MSDKVVKPFEPLGFDLQAVLGGSMEDAVEMAKSVHEKYLDWLGWNRVKSEDHARQWAFFSKFVPLWLKLPQEQRGAFTIKYALGKHVESPLSIIIQKDGRDIASVGGFAHLDLDNKRTLTINNLQGVAITKHATDEQNVESKKERRKRLAGYAKLDKELGENWRTYFVKQAVMKAKENGWKVVGALPRRYLFHSTSPEYLRVVHAYEKAYADAGLVMKRIGLWKL